MSPNACVFLYLLLEQGTLHGGGGVLFRPLCGDDGMLKPPLVSEARARRMQEMVARGEEREERQMPGSGPRFVIDFAAPGSGAYTLRAPLDFFITQGLSAESCFG